ncbi:MAG: ABC transporter ATP-binding protein [Proteobacteria bacterium]|nr:ABC transporter ATP-binding protein [Pseudomonadota bacterium]
MTGDANANANAPLLSVQGLTLASRHASVVDALSFDVHPGEVLGIVGESGSGKTMAARAVIGLLPQAIRRTAGRIVFEGQDLAALAPAALRRVRGRRIGMVFQEPMTSLNPALTIGRQLDEGLAQQTTLGRDERRERIVAMLARIGLPDGGARLTAYPHEFSGGMRQRIMIASAMLMQPALLIADEPTTALDAVIQREVAQLMLGLTREQGAAAIVISHDLAMVAEFAQRVVVMEAGRIVETGSSEAILLQPRHPYTRRLLDALPRRAPARAVARTPVPVLEVRDLAVDFPGRRGLFRRKSAPKQAVRGVSLQVMAGETVALVGASGSGKTTVGRAIVGLQAASRGEVLFQGRPIGIRDAAAHQAWRQGCQMVFQDPYGSLDPRMRVAELVAEALRALRRPEAAERVRQTLAEVGLDPAFGERFPHELSGGQRQRVAIARAIVRKPAFVVADEPVSALDMTVQKQILSLIRALQDKHGFACLFVSHDLGAVEQVADRVLVMDEGQIVEDGARDQVFDHARHPVTRRLLGAMPALQPEGEGFRLLRRQFAPA